MDIKQLLLINQGKTLTLNDSYLIGSSWTYHNYTLTRNHRVLLGMENIPSISCVVKENSLLFTLENDSKVKMSYENEEIILQFPGFSTTKHHYKKFIWN